MQHITQHKSHKYLNKWIVKKQKTKKDIRLKETKTKNDKNAHFHLLKTFFFFLILDYT